MQLAIVILQPAILLPGSQDKARPDGLLWREFYEGELIKMYAGTYSHHLNLHFTRTYYGVCQRNHNSCVCAQQKETALQRKAVNQKFNAALSMLTAKHVMNPVTNRRLCM
uniref:Uncharacterized protein n=1 Tax=Rhipicephalus zambeziensis TaxID=60191 RepID=A0A224YER8_9ACAR